MNTEQVNTDDVAAIAEKAMNPPPKKGPDQTAQLLKLCDGFTYIHDAGPMREPYVLVDGRTLGEGEISDILTGRFYDKTRRAPTREALKSAVDTIKVQCLRGPATRTYLRFANFRDVVYWDLSNDANECIKITADAISIIKDPPVVFRRTGNTLPLVAPADKAVAFTELADVLNLDSHQLPLVEGWALSCFQPEGDLPILALLGEHGAIKTSVIEKLVSLLSPTKLIHRGLPDNEKDYVVGGKNTAILAFDNVSFMKSTMSDIACRVATGAGIAIHTFYETTGETSLTLQLPQIFSGIGFITRADFADRCITVTLNSLAESGRKRKRKARVAKQFTDLLPGLVRYLCETVQAGLKGLDSMESRVDEEAKLPRMADFATWAAACTGYSFLAIYNEMSNSRESAVLEDDQVAVALIAWAGHIVLGKDTGIVLTMTELLQHLNCGFRGKANGIPG